MTTPLGNLLIKNNSTVSLVQVFLAPGIHYAYFHESLVLILEDRGGWKGRGVDGGGEEVTSLPFDDFTLLSIYSIVS